LVLGVGCASLGRDNARIVYRPHGEIKACVAYGGEGDTRAFLWDYYEEPSEEGVLRVVKLDLKTAKATVESEHPYPLPSGVFFLQVAVSPQGARQAMIGNPSGDESQVYVRGEAANWAPVTPAHKGTVFLLRWSPDGNAIAYLLMAGRQGTQAAVASMYGPGEQPTERVVTPEDCHSVDIAWADSDRLCHVARWPSGEDVLEVVKWPSLERRTVFTASSLGRLSVAQDSRDTLFLVTPQGEVDPEHPQTAQSDVYRLTPDGQVEQTAAVLDSVPFCMAVSPDGDRLAAAPRTPEPEAWRIPYGRGLVIYSLRDGTSHAVDALQDKDVFSVDWVLGGRAVLAAEPNGVWLIPAAAGASPTGTYDVEEAPPSPAAEADRQSRKNLQALGMALLTYMADHGDRYPQMSSMETVRQALAPYRKSEDVFEDPRTGEPYGVNMSLSGKRLVDVDDPFDTVVFFETTPTEDGGRNVTLVDGSVAHLSADKWQEAKQASSIE